MPASPANSATIFGIDPSGALSPIGVSAAIAATDTLTLAANPGDGETVTVGGKTYTFNTAITAAENSVLIGAAATDSIDNLIAAINHTTGDGTLYSAATKANERVTAAVGAGDTMGVTAIEAGVYGNSIAATETLTNGGSVWASATLKGGVNAAFDAGPKGNAAAITPHDSTNLSNPTTGIYVGGLGAVVAIVNGVAVTFAAVPAGTILPIRATRVNSTNTTATNLVALW